MENKFIHIKYWKVSIENTLFGNYITYYKVMFVCLRPFQQYYIGYIGGQFLSHLSWEEPVLDSFPPLQTTKRSNQAKEVTGLEVIDTNHSVTEVVRN